MKFAICDDEPIIRNEIERNIRILYSDADIIQYESGKCLLDSSGNEQFDILFLDIRMDGTDGMQTARSLRQSGSNVIIIFVTAVEEYVFQAFDVGAFHYLLKPIERVKFFEVLKNAVAESKGSDLRHVKEGACVAIKKGSVTQKVYLSDIIYIEVLNRKIIVHKADENIEFYGRLGEFENNLNSDFVRCHRAYIVNMRYVLKYNAGSIFLENKEKVLMSKQKYPEFVKRYMGYISGLAHKQECLRGKTNV